MQLSAFDRSFLWILCGTSAAITLLLIVLVIWSGILRRDRRDAAYRKGISFLWVCLLLLLSVWTLRYAVNFYLLRYPTCDEDNALTGFEQIFNSFVHALQTFSMDESYTEYIRSGKEMMTALTHEESGFVSFYGIYASLLNLAAPIAGGAIVFQILTSFFPHVRLFIGAHAPWKHLYFFSELNECSMALAKSILREHDAKAMIVFANVDTPSDEVEKSDLLDKAKNINAVCVRCDLTNLHLHLNGPRAFYFMDQNEMLNLNMLLTMASEDECQLLRNAEVYLFAEAALYERVEQQLYDALVKRGYTEEDMPLTLPICTYQNLVFNLLTKMPLIEPLIPNRTDNSPQELRLTVLGMGRIGTELLLDAFWCGQMLGCKLHINVISMESEEQFRQKLDSVNPELIQTMQPNNPLLRINGKGDFAEPYCTMRYYQADLESESLRSLLRAEPEDGAPALLDTDYFAVTLGADDRNLRMANIIQQECGRKHLEYLNAHRGEQVPVPRTLIAYAVYDSALCKALNSDALQSSAYTDSNDIYLYAFGSLEHEYSVANIMMPEMISGAKDLHDNYLQHASNPEQRKQMRRYRAGFLIGKNKGAGYYSLWASIARLTHAKYKMFSVGLRMPSVFAPDADITWQQTIQAFSALATADPEQNPAETLAPYRAYFTDGALPERKSDLKRILNENAWLEHRRWCAFLRTRGYQHTVAEELYYDRTENHKELRLRLHPCLVECDKNGMHKDICAEIAACAGDPEKLAAFDMLDLLTYHLTVNQQLDEDFKLYDYPNKYLEESKHYIELFHAQ